MWVAAHQDLLDDPKYGDRHRRFLPSRFDLLGRAVDPLGEACTEIACPNCLLTIARDLLELPPIFLSILGAPSSGKSYFLATATWQLRRVLSSQFRVSLEDADPAANRKLHEYEELLFLSRDPDEPVALPKTELDGDLYQKAFIRDQTILYARPFVFRLRLLPNHARAADDSQFARTVCLYDNAGENFLPGVDSTTRPGTRHLSVSKALLFLFDPTQHTAFRQACEGYSLDPQMQGAADHKELKTLTRQDQILTEAANRISAGQPTSQRLRDSRPLIVVVTKFDAWMSLTGNKALVPDWLIQTSPEGVTSLHIGHLRDISDRIRQLLNRHVPEIVNAAEAFSSDVTFIPVSALGTPPELGPPGPNGKRALLIRPRDIRPNWIEIPLLYALQRSIPGLIPKI